MKKVAFLLLTFLIACLIFVLVVYLLSTRRGKGALQVTSTPDSQVYINDKLVGETPLCKCDGNNLLDEGEYSLKLVPTDGDYEPFVRKVTISPKVMTVLDRTFDQTAFSQASVITLIPISDKEDAQINVISFPADSQVYLDSSLVGNTPTLLKNVTISDHEIRVTKNGYKDKSVRIKTVAGYKLEAIIYMGVDPDVTKDLVPVSSSSAKQTTSKDKITISDTPTGFLRVRKNSSVASVEVGKVNPKDTFEVLDEENGWYKIELEDKTVGWVSGQYVTKN